MKYKQINENWKRFLTEQDKPQINTVGELKKVLQIIATKGRAEGGKEFIKDFGAGLLADLIPGGASIKQHLTPIRLFILLMIRQKQVQDLII